MAIRFSRNLGNITGLMAGKFGSYLMGGFQSLCSFLFDGVDDYFTINNSELVGVMNSNTSFSYTGVIKRNSVGGVNSQTLIGNWGGTGGFTLRFEPGSTLKVFAYNSAAAIKTAATTNAFTSTSDWYFITFVYDPTQALGSRAIFYVNGVNEATSSDDLDVSILATEFDFTTSQNGIEFGNYAMNSFSVINKALTLSEHQDYYNNGAPKDAKKLFPANTVYSWIPQDALPYDAVNNEWAVPNGVNPPLFNKSLLFDGIDNYMTMPTTNLDPNIFGGTGNQYTIYADITAPSNSSLFYLFTANPNSVWLTISNGIVRVLANGATSDIIGNTNLTEGENYNITVSLDFENVSNHRFSVNGVGSSLAANTSSSVNTTPTGYEMGRRNNNSSFHNGYVKSMSVINRTTTLEEDILMYNGGAGANPYTIFSDDCKWFMSADNAVWNGSAYEVTDSVSSNVATSVNMAEADLKYRSPNLSYSSNMVEESKNCNLNPYE